METEQENPIKAIAGKIAGNLVRLGRGLRDAAQDVLVNIGFQIHALLCDPIPMTCRPCSLLHAHGPVMSDISTQRRVAHCARCCMRITPLMFEMPFRKGNGATACIPHVFAHHHSRQAA